MRIYMDACCYMRLNDESLHERITIETIAIVKIIEISAKRNWTIVSSDPLDYEINNAKYGLDKARTTYKEATTEHLTITEETKSLEPYYEGNGIDPMDRIHLSVAQKNLVDIFLTTDATLLKRATKAQKHIGNTTKIANPVNFLMEITNGN